MCITCALHSGRIKTLDICLQTFMEPYQCKRQQEQRCRAFRQLQSYMSMESGGYMLPRMSDDTLDLRIGVKVDSDVEWPLRMIRQRQLARKSNHNTQNLVADLLDMPDLSNDWGTLNFPVKITISPPSILPTYAAQHIEAR